MASPLPPPPAKLTGVPFPTSEAHNTPLLLAYPQGQPLHQDQEPLIPAVHAQRRQPHLPSSQPRCRDCNPEQVHIASDCAANTECLDQCQFSADILSKAADQHNKVMTCVQPRPKRDQGGHFLDMPVKDPRGIFCLHSVPCCSGPFNEAGLCYTSCSGRFCSCQLPMPLARRML